MIIAINEWYEMNEEWNDLTLQVVEIQNSNEEKHLKSEENKYEKTSKIGDSQNNLLMD